MAQTYNEHAEMAVLSSIFQDGSAYRLVEDMLKGKSFGYLPFGHIYRAIRRVVESDLYPDVTTVGTDLETNGLLEAIVIPSVDLRGRDALNYILQLKNIVPSQIESYGLQVQKLYANRQLIALADKIKAGVEKNIDPVENLTNVDLETGQIGLWLGYKSGSLRVSSEVAQKSLENFANAANGESRYILTGFNFWDDFVGGLYEGRLYLIAGRANEGKTSLAQNIARALTIDASPERRVKTVYFTFESSAEEVVNKLVQSMTGIHSMRVEKGKLSQTELPAYSEAIQKIQEAPLIFDDSSEIVLAMLRTKIRKAVTAGAKVIIIDQLEQVHIGGSGDYQAEYLKINYIAYRIKAFAREMNVPIVLVHQMNRGIESEQSKGQKSEEREPSLKDLAQAGEKPPNAVLMIRHKKRGQVPYETWLYWVKNRDGRKGKIQVEWKPERISFSDMVGQSEFSPDFVQGEFPNEHHDGEDDLA